jgi:Fusaric acid resistance protein-like
VASDPGLGRLALALAVGVSVSVTIAVEYAFAQIAHPLWLSAASGVALPPPRMAQLVAQHRGVSELTMLIGGIVALMSVLVNGPTVRNRAITIVGMPIPLLASLALGIELAPHHALGLVVFTLVVAVGAYGRKFVPRFGPRAFTYGSLLFVGYLIGFLAGHTLQIGQLDWLAAIMWLAAAVDLALRLVIYDPLARGVMARGRRSFSARARTVFGAAIDLLDAQTDGERRRRGRRLRRQLARLNEAALTIDAQLGDPRFQRAPDTAGRSHEELFELELSIHSVGQLAHRLASSETPRALQVLARDWLAELRAGHTTGAARAVRAPGGERPDATLTALDDQATNLAYGLATETVHVGESLQRWARLGVEPPRSVAPVGSHGYESPVVLRPDGRLRGSAAISQATATTTARHGLLSRLLPGWAGQTSIRLAVAVGAACAAGSALSERRFYWAVIAVFIAFTGANTAGEQLIKALERVVGTFVGILIGSLLANAIGVSAWSLAVIIPALTIGVYFVQVNYWLMAAGITIMVSQLYVQLGEYSPSLLALRLKETALGAVIAMLAAVLIFPVSTRRAARVATAGYFDALGSLLARIPGALLQPPGARRLTGDSRALDDAMQQLLATAHPLARSPLPGPEREHRLGLITASADFSRRLASEADHADQLDERSAEELRHVLATQQASLAALSAAVRGNRDGAKLDPTVGRLAGIDRYLSEASPEHADGRRPMLRAIGSLDKTLVALGESFGLSASDDDPSSR